MNPTLLGTGEAARMCGVAPRTVAKWIDAGLLTGYRVPNSSHRRVHVEVLLEFLRRHGMPVPEEARNA